MAVGERVTAVVPSTGVSPLLWACLRALRRAGGDELEIVLVWQGDNEPWPEAAAVADRVERLTHNLGFAAATNHGIHVTDRELVATVNDDVLVDRGWLDHLVEACDRDPRVAAVQGVNRMLDEPDRLDGCGLAWNADWQAVQIGHGRSRPRAGAEREIFGVSATAAIYRRSALDVVARGGHAFDTRLVSYYEDVELASRLRAVGYSALFVPASGARHAGSVTGNSLGWRKLQLLYGNRILVLAETLGCDFRRRLPAILDPDLRDLLRAALRLDGTSLRGILAGWARAWKSAPDWRRRGEPAPGLAVFERFRETL